MSEHTVEPRLTDRFDDALAYASKLHRHQTRKGAGIPYVSHLLGVASLAIEAGADEDQAIAALLHDAVEDQGGEAQAEAIRDRFGDRVARIVMDCTDATIEPKPPWRERKQAYLATLNDKSRDSLLVSMADKTHNAQSIVNDLRAHGPVVWQRFTGGAKEPYGIIASLPTFSAAGCPGRARSASLAWSMKCRRWPMPRCNS